MADSGVACPSCTFINAVGMSKCEMCDTTLPKAATPSVVPKPAVATRPIVPRATAAAPAVPPAAVAPPKELTEAEGAEVLRALLLEVTTAQAPDTPRHLYKVTVPGIRKLLREILAAIAEVSSNAAKARVDLAARVAEVPSTPAVDAEAISLARQIDEAEARKIAALEKEAVTAEDALEKLSGMVADAQAELDAYDAKTAAPVAAAMAAVTL